MDKETRGETARPGSPGKMTARVGVYMRAIFHQVILKIKIMLYIVFK